MRLRRRDAFGAAVVENGVVEGAGPHRGVEVGHGLFQRGRIERRACRRARGCVGAADRRKERRHEHRDDGGVEDDVGDLVRLRRDQPAPDRVALRPDVLALVVEALRVLVDDDAEDHAVVPRDDAAVVFRRARVDRDRVALGRIADLLRRPVEQHLQHGAAIVRRAADQEIVRRRAPVLLQPFDVGLEAAAGRDERRRRGSRGARR